MSDSEVLIATAPAAQQPTDQQRSMETEAQSQASQNDILQEGSKKLDTSNLTFRIWPPTQRTRDAVIARLIETLTTPSILSKRYGAIPTAEADSAARQIENEAFSVADAAASAEDDGIEVLQVYSKEISKRMLESVKSRAAPTVGGLSTSGDECNNGDDPSGSLKDSEESVLPSHVTET